MFNEKIGILDIGSNTIRLVIYGIDDNFNYSELHNVKTPARLSENLIQEDDRTLMTQEGIDKLIKVLNSFKQVAESFAVADLLPMATAAVRQSANLEEIKQQVLAATGLKLNLVSEEDEATYGQYAIAHSTTVNDALTIDIGGGSCEVTLYKDKELIHYQSFPFGAVSLSKQFFEDKSHNDPKAIEELAKFVRKHFKKYDWIKKAKLDIVAIGGSARNLANVHQRAINYPMAGLHGYAMSLQDIEDTLTLFCNTSFNNMDSIEGLSTDRQDLIIPATLVFLELFNISKANAFKLSSQGLREGIILKYINDNYNYPLDNQLIRLRSIRRIIRDFPINTFGAQIQVDITISLYRQLCDLGIFEYSYEEQEELEFASYIYRFANFISNEADSQHTFYLVSNMSLLGFSHQKRLRLALLSSFRNRSLMKQYYEGYQGWLNDQEFEELETLGGVLKFSAALNDSKTGPIQKLKLNKNKDGSYQLDIYHDNTIVAEKYRIARHRKHFERSLDGPLTINYIQHS